MKKKDQKVESPRQSSSTRAVKGSVTPGKGTPKPAPQSPSAEMTPRTKAAKLKENSGYVEIPINDEKKEIQNGASESKAEIPSHENLLTALVRDMLFEEEYAWTQGDTFTQQFKSLFTRKNFIAAGYWGIYLGILGGATYLSFLSTRFYQVNGQKGVDLLPFQSVLGSFHAAVAPSAAQWVNLVLNWYFFKEVLDGGFDFFESNARFKKQSAPTARVASVLRGVIGLAWSIASAYPYADLEPTAAAESIDFMAYGTFNFLGSLAILNILEKYVLAKLLDKLAPRLAKCKPGNDDKAPFIPRAPISSGQINLVKKKLEWLARNPDFIQGRRDREVERFLFNNNGSVEFVANDITMRFPSDDEFNQNKTAWEESKCRAFLRGANLVSGIFVSASTLIGYYFKTLETAGPALGNLYFAPFYGLVLLATYGRFSRIFNFFENTLPKAIGCKPTTVAEDKSKAGPGESDITKFQRLLNIVIIVLAAESACTSLGLTRQNAPAPLQTSLSSIAILGLALFNSIGDEVLDLGFKKLKRRWFFTADQRRIVNNAEKTVAFLEKHGGHLENIHKESIFPCRPCRGSAAASGG